MYLVFKLKVVKGRGYKTHKNKAVRKGHEEETKTDLETEEEQETPFPLPTHIINILHSFFSNVEVYINTQQI